MNLRNQLIKIWDRELESDVEVEGAQDAQFGSCMTSLGKLRRR